MKMTRSYENMSCEQMARDINSISFVGSRSHIWLPLMYKKHFSKFNRLIIKSIQTSVKFYMNSMVYIDNCIIYCAITGVENLIFVVFLIIV